MSKINFFTQLDALRAVAIIMTVLAHYAGIPYMHLGVDLFFTISGFLITSILLKSREYELSFIQVIKKFIIRRALRLFPAYYLYLFFFFALSSLTTLYVGDKTFFLYHFTYTTNFLLFYHFDEVYLSFFGHLWSLCVEEQFYLIWPWLILLFPSNGLKFLLISIILFGLGSHALFSEGEGIYAGIRFMTIGNFHTLGSGGLLAVLWFGKSSKVFNRVKNNAKTLLLTTLILFIVFVMYYPNKTACSEVYKLIRQLLLSAVLFFIVLATIKEWTGIIGRIAKNNWMQYIGKISYGIYLYHMPIPYFVHISLTKFHLENYLFLKPYFSVILTLLIASISFRYLEQPFLKLKAKFN